MDKIYKLLDQTHDHKASLQTELATNIADHVSNALASRSQEREVGKLWASDIGEQCTRKLWYKFHDPDGAEEMGGHTLFKFLYGNVIEELVIGFLREAGEQVEDEQKRLEVEMLGWKISGRKDLRLNGDNVDVKSTSSYGFKKYKQEGITKHNDTFGYIDQLSFYEHYDDPSSSSPAFIWVDKQNGHILLDHVQPTPKEDLEDTIKDKIVRLDNDRVVPPRAFRPVPYGKSGNEALDLACSYCPFKHKCWPGLQGYHYNHGPVWLTKVAREPNVNKIQEE